MKQYVQFLIDHWILWLAFVVVIILILIEEIRGRVMGVSRVQPQDLTRLINREDALVVDLRDTNSFVKGHIVNSMNIPRSQFNESISKLTKYKDKPIVFVCANGQASSQEGLKLKKEHFEKIYSLSGGISAWQSAGLPLTRD